MAERPRRRLAFIAGLSLVVSLVLVGQLVQVQLFRHAELVQAAEALYTRRGEITPLRGRIYDQRGHLVAGNQVEYEVSVTPELVADPVAVAIRLAPLLQRDPLSLWEAITRQQRWVLLAPRVEKSVGEQIAGLGLAGVNVVPRWRRVYPEGTLGAHLLGFVNAEQVGYYGVEGFYQQELAGSQGTRVDRRDPYGGRIPLSLAQGDPPRPGADLVLTVDWTVQAVVEAELDRALEETGAEQGCIIVMDPRTGRILALAARPTYDPNRYFEAEERQFVNLAVGAQYEPGSVFKILTMAVALEAGLVTPESGYQDQGEIEVGGQVIRNWDRQAYGWVTMADVLAYSLNVGVARLATLLGPPAFYQGIRAFGVDRPTGVDLEGEVAGELRLPSDPTWHESDLGTNAFGQGLAVTPLQMIVAVAAVANDGLLMRPYVVAEQRWPDGRVVRARPAVQGRAISQETARTLTQMLVEAVAREVPQAQVEGYTIAGKTGTAQVPIPGGYDPQQTIASFVGYGPAEAPRLIILVRLDKPKSSPWGSQTAAPVFGRLAARLFVLLGIPPS